jgi:hypothetical protein
MNSLSESKKKIYKIAKQVRFDFENKQLDLKLLASVYLQHAFVEDINSFVNIAINQFPKHCCGLCSSYLKHKIKEGTLIEGIYDSYCHTFLLLKNNLIVDITADQFGGPKIYVGHMKKPWSFEE